MILLCSNGLSSEKLLSCLAEKTAECKSAALVVTADHVYKEKNYHVPRCIAELESLHLRVDTFDLDTQPPQQLLRYDVVEFIGGNPYYLLNAIRTSEAAAVLKDIAERRILIGWSAAAFVFSPTLELVDRYSAEMNFLGMSNLSGLALTDVEVLPHYQKYLKRFEHFEETCAAYERECHTHVIRISDGEGVFIENGDVRICRL